MPPKINLKGQIINNIEIIEEAPRRNGRIYWRCKCYCGNIFETEGYSIKTGHTKSCGCKTNKKNELGNRYGSLIVIEEATNDDKGNARWLCQCDCGNQIVVLGRHLRNGNTASCGCVRIKKIIEYNRQHNIKDISNQRFGILTALEPTEMRSGKAVIWKCKCDCGKETYISGSDLRSGNTKSCGCQKYKSQGENKIKNILEQNNILFQQEYSFPNLIFKDTGYQARFDFYVNNSYIIEYDGIQHFIQGNGVYDNEQKFTNTKEHDRIKNEYCFKNNIPIIRIPYTELDNITLEMLQPETSKYLLQPVE